MTNYPIQENHLIRAFIVSQNTNRSQKCKDTIKDLASFCLSAVSCTASDSAEAGAPDALWALAAGRAGVCFICPHPGAQERLACAGFFLRRETISRESWLRLPPIPGQHESQPHSRTWRWPSAEGSGAHPEEFKLELAFPPWRSRG